MLYFEVSYISKGVSKDAYASTCGSSPTGNDSASAPSRCTCTQRLTCKILAWSSSQTYTLAIQHAYLRIRLLFNNDKKLLEKYTFTFCYLISGVVPAPFDLLTPDFKNVATGQLWLHTLSHKCTPPSHKKWGLETNLCLMYIYRTVGGHAPFPAFSR